MWLLRHRIYLQRPDKCKVLFLGDSITEGWLDAGIDVWKQKFGEPMNAFNIGIGGDEVQHVLWRVQDSALRDLDPKVVVLMIGTNNLGVSGHSAARIHQAIATLLRELKSHLPHSQFLLLGVLPRDEHPDTQFRKEIMSLNQLIKQFAEDEANVVFHDFGKLFLNADGTISQDIMPDFLHLSPKGYAIWANSLEPILSDLIENSKSQN